MSYFNPTIQPPYYAVIFYNQKTDQLQGYAEMDALTLELAEQVEGYLGNEFVSKDNQTLFISYWESLDAIERWKHNTQHQVAKKMGISQWYEWYAFRICKVEHHHVFTK